MSLVFALAACGWVPVASEREAIASYVWHKRGMEVGELMRLYCMAGSRREQRWMYEALDHHAAPARVTIACPD